jgi:uncharacterized protein YjiS (DUF1127 family)
MRKAYVGFYSGKMEFLEMTMTLSSLERETIRHANRDGGILGRVQSLVSRTRAIRQLRQLDDRLLADIGLSRGEIETSVWGRR